MSPKEVEDQLDRLMRLAREQNYTQLSTEIHSILEENYSLKAQLETNQVNGEVLFEIDSNPGHENKTVIYDSNKSSVLGSDGVTEELDQPANNASKNSCFNCSGNHQLPDCTMPRDARRIQQNRQRFLNSTPRSVRYHADETQKFGHLKPGLPSSELKIALGLRDFELPSYIYRMREIGLSPGWLRAAESNTSGLDVYLDRENNDQGADGEEGEVVDETGRKGYDFTKIPEWPGFNMPFPENFREESSRYRVPPINFNQFKTTMCDKYKKTAEPLNSSSGVKRKLEKLTEQTVKRQKSNDNNEPLSTTVVNVVSSTPICARYSPFDSLPESEKWTTNTTDHLLYENLPETTGKYEKLREILQKVREAKLNS